MRKHLGADIVNHQQEYLLIVRSLNTLENKFVFTWLHDTFKVILESFYVQRYNKKWRGLTETQLFLINRIKKEYFQEIVLLFSTIASNYKIIGSKVDHACNIVIFT